MTSDQRIRQRYPYVADLPEGSRGGGPDSERMHKWLCDRFGGPQEGRW